MFYSVLSRGHSELGRIANPCVCQHVDELNNVNILVFIVKVTDFNDPIVGK